MVEPCLNNVRLAASEYVDQADHSLDDPSVRGHMQAIYRNVRLLEQPTVPALSAQAYDGMSVVRVVGAETVQNRLCSPVIKG